MTQSTARTSVLSLLTCALILPATTAHAQSAGVYRTPTDTPVCLAPSAQPSTTGQFLVGYASGRIVRLSATDSEPRTTWETRATGEVLALLEIARPSAAEHDLLAATATGQLLCFRGDATEPAWRFESTCEVSTLAEFADVDGDGTSDVLAGGADHRIHLLSGRTGREIWTHFFESKEGSTYVMRLLVMPDTDHDNTPDVAVDLWSGELAVLSGRTGTLLWIKQIGGGMTDGFATLPDLDGDGLADLLVGDNQCVVQACSGRDGTVFWTGPVTRPIRELVVAPTTAATPPVAYVCTAGGDVVRFDLDPKSTPAKPRWTTNLGDICRCVVVVEDVDDDRVPDVAACAENGVAAVLSGQTGKILHRWQTGDVVRTLSTTRANDRPMLALASLDGTVLLTPANANAAMPTPAAAATATTTPTHAAPTETSDDPRVIILLYHDILPEECNHYSTSVDRFRAQMDMLVEEHYVCVSLDQIADWVEGKIKLPARAVCLTFDGQYRGQATYAAPILRAHGFFATSYITTDWIGTTNHCDWRQICELDAAGLLDAQNHTISHPYFTRCDRDEIVRQLAESNQAIARHMHGKVARHHAYPAGAHNDAIHQTTREQGFRTATTVRPGPVPRDIDLMNLPRYMLCTHKTPAQFRSWLTGEEAPAN